jgi:hypothetical protein
MKNEEVAILLMLNIGKILMLKKTLSKMKTKTATMVVLSLALTSCAHNKSDINRQPSSAISTTNNLTAREIKYESCTAPHKLYLEEKMQQIPAEYFALDKNSTQEKIPMQCIQLAQRSFVGHFAICNNDEDKPKVSVVRPCMTEKYVNLSYNAYHDVMDCFNLDPREMFYQIMIESGFHINAINKTGFDSGISQFTANGIKRVTANNLVERTRRVLLESSRPSCQRISSIMGAFSIDAFSVKKRCSMIMLPKNPYRAMMFGYLHTMLDRITLEEHLAQMPEIYEALTDRIRRQLLYVSYNRGMTGLLRLLRGYIESRQHFAHRITEEDLDLNKNLSGVKSILKLEPEKRQILQKSKVRNLSFAEYAVINNAVYLSDMSAAREYVERYYGNTCGDF